MSALADTIARARSEGDYEALLAALPYTRMLGMHARLDAGTVRLSLPFRQGLVGNPVLPAFHGGVLGACLETAGLLQVLHERGTSSVPKTIDFTVDFLRAARGETLYAEAEVQRSGRRIVNVRMRAYQADPRVPVALGRGHFLL